MFTFYKMVSAKHNTMPATKTSEPVATQTPVPKTTTFPSGIDAKWQVWHGKVIGSEQDIKQALQTMKRPPKSAKELEDVIFDQRGKNLTQTLDRAKNSLY